MTVSKQKTANLIEFMSRKGRPVAHIIYLKEPYRKWWTASLYTIMRQTEINLLETAIRTRCGRLAKKKRKSFQSHGEEPLFL